MYHGWCARVAVCLVALEVAAMPPLRCVAGKKSGPPRQRKPRLVSVSSPVR